LKNANEEDYLENLLKSMDDKTEVSNEEPNSGTVEPMIDSKENSEHNVIEELAVSEELADSEELAASVQLADLKDPSVSENLDNISIDIANQIGKAITGVISDDNIVTNELSEEYNDLFEPEDSDFKISDIPDREPAELTQSEMDRLADMNSDEILDDEANESLSVNQLFDENDNMLKENSLKGIDSNDKVGGSILDNDILEAEAIAAAASAITSGVISSATDIKPKFKIKSKKSDKKKSDKKKSDKKKIGKKINILKFIKNIFFEDSDQVDQLEQANQLDQAAQVDLAQQDSTDKHQEPKDENQRVLEELYGDNAQEEFINDNDYKGNNDFTDTNDNSDNSYNIKPVKKGFLAKWKAKSAARKANLAESAKAEEDAEELEFNKKKDAKTEKKLTAKNKKDQAKSKKAESKKPKPEKVKKPKKEKKPKEPTKPQDILKIKPLSLVLLLSFVVGIVVLIEIGNTAFYYNNDISQAQLYFQNENYQKAYDSLQGVDLKPADEELYNQINTIMFVQKQYTSYQNYVKLGMGVEALDSLIKGVERYYTYYPTAKELGVSEQLDANKELIVSALKSTFSMSEEKAISYGSLADLDFTQYYLTLESYGGMVTK